MSQITILNQSNVPMGPFTRDQVTEKLRKGEVTMSSLAFIEGLSQWTPLRDVLARVDAVAPQSRPMASSVPAAPAPRTPSPAYSYAATMQPPSHLVYAGFWLRFVAVFIDGLILMVIGFMLGGAIGFAFGVSGALGTGGRPMRITDPDGALNLGFVIMEVIVIGVMTVIRWLYFALQESSSAQGTLGKRALGLRVTDLEGCRISFLRATGRFFGKYISGMILGIGFIMAGLTERKQALHDMIAGTLVVRD